MAAVELGELLQLEHRVHQLQLRFRAVIQQVKVHQLMGLVASNLYGSRGRLSPRARVIREPGEQLKLVAISGRCGGFASSAVDGELQVKSTAIYKQAHYG